MTLPPLPPPEGYWSASLPYNYTADQMRSYAEAAVADLRDELERLRAILDGADILEEDNGQVWVVLKDWRATT